MMTIALQRNLSFTSVGSPCNPMSKSLKAAKSSLKHLEGDARLVEVEPAVGALLKPPQGKRCSAMPTKSEFYHMQVNLPEEHQREINLKAK